MLVKLFYPTCKRCGRKIDKETIDFWKRKRRKTPKICGICLAEALMKLIEEVNND